MQVFEGQSLEVFEGQILSALFVDFLRLSLIATFWRVLFTFLETLKEDLLAFLRLLMAFYHLLNRLSFHFFNLKYLYGLASWKRDAIGFRHSLDRHYL